jgi:hypothetical protein
MNDIAPALVGTFFFLCVAAVIGSYLFTRHRERMAIIEKGLQSEVIKSLYKRESGKPAILSSLKWGLVFLVVGLAASIGVWLRQVYYLPEGIIFSFVVLGAGVGLVLFYLIARKQADQSV